MGVDCMKGADGERLAGAGGLTATAFRKNGLSCAHSTSGDAPAMLSQLLKSGMTRCADSGQRGVGGWVVRWSEIAKQDLSRRPRGGPLRLNA